MEERIRTTKDQRDRQYIKEELMRYYMYRDKIIDIEREIEAFKIEYQATLADPLTSGSIIKCSNNLPSYQNVVMRLESKLDDMESNLQYYKNHIGKLDKWLAILTDMQTKIAMVYICQYQCKNAYGASLELQYSEDTIKEYAGTIIKRIQKKFDKIF